MVPIIRRTSVLYISHICTFSLFAVQALAGLRHAAFLMPMLLPVWLTSSVLWTEREEAHRFLRTLPTTDREIVRVKFGLALAATFVYAGLMSAVTLLVRDSEEPLAPRLALIALSCAVSLLLAGCCYIGIWGIGPSVMTGVIVTFMLANLAVGIALVKAFADSRWGLFEEVRLLRGVPGAPWWLHALLVALALLAYYGLSRLAVRVKEQSEACL